MKIIVNEKNREKIEKAIREAEGKARARTVDFGGINYMVHVKIAAHMRGLTKAEMLGCKVYVDENAQDFPRAYAKKAHAAPESTQYELTCTASGWALTAIYRAPVKAAYLQLRAELTEPAKAAFLRLAEHFGNPHAARYCK